MQKTVQFLLMTALLLGGSSITGLAASTWYVAPTGSDDNDGTSSWVQAFATISNAVAKAAFNDTILVSNGTYTISAEIPLTNTSLTIQGYMNGVYGGLSVASNTIVKRGAVGAAAPQHRIFNIVGGDTGTNVLDGLTITNGYLSGLHGGGIYGSDRYLTIRNCIVAGNTALGGAGGGIYFNANAFGAITNCIVAGNYANEGGGIMCNAMAATSIRNCLIRHNTATNTAGSRGGGGIEIVNGANYPSLDIYDCTIVSNSCLGYGGGFFAYCSASTAAIIDGCLIQGNTGAYGGGIVLREAPTAAIVRNSRIIGNTANYGGGLYFINNTAPKIHNSLIADNTATTRGGAIDGQYFQLQNCTLARNSAGTYGGIYASTVNIRATNTIVSANSPDTSFGLTNFANSCSPSLTHGLSGNITNDPQFVLNTANGNYRLGPNSPCINTGTNQAWMTNALDVAGTRRVDRIIAPIVDMGAYEYHPQGLLFLGR